MTDYRNLLPRLVKGACEWILTHPLFSSWAKETGHALLWVVGHAGCGKTMLSSFLFQWVERSRDRDVFIYFCDGRVKDQRDGNAILIGLIFQMVHRHHSMIRYVRKAYDLHGVSLLQSFSSLWEIFSKMVRDPKCGPLCIILDAIDECERTSRRQLLESINTLMSELNRSPTQISSLKFFLTSRPMRDELFNYLESFMDKQLHLDDGKSGYQEGLQTFIRQRVDQLASTRHCSDEVKQFLVETLLTRADQTFLWIHMVLSSLDNRLLASVKDLKAMITSIPPELKATYTSFLSAIPSDHREQALRLLKLIVSSTRPLHLKELNVAFSIEPSHSTVEELTQECQTAMENTLQGILGPLIRISESRVSLVHQSAREYLLQDDASVLLVSQQVTSAENASLCITSACIQYLLLHDFDVDIFQHDGSSSSSIYDSSPSDSMASTLADLSLFGKEQDLAAEHLFREDGVLDVERAQEIAEKDDFFGYASLYWMEHLAACERLAPCSLRESARKLLDMQNTNSQNWLQSYLALSNAAPDLEPDDHDPIILSSYFNLTETLKSLLGTTESTQATRSRALFWACQKGNDAVVLVLLESDVDPNFQDSYQKTALMVAAGHGHTTCVAALVQDGRAHLSQRARNGINALSLACSNGHLPVVQLLLSQPNCGIGNLDNRGCTPFIHAASGGNTSVISALAKHSVVDINHCDKGGRTALSWAAGDGLQGATAHLLKLKHIQANLEDKKGRSPLSWAAGNGHADTVRALIFHKKVDPVSLDQDKRNAISWACASGHADALRVILEKTHCGIDDKDIDGWTPLAWAIEIDSPATVEILLSPGKVDLEQRDHGGRTALSWAVEYGHTSIVKILLRKGADPTTRSDFGTTPISYAEKFGRDDLVELLSKHIKERALPPTE